MNDAGRPVLDVFVDDVRPCPPGFALARNAEEALLMLRECRVRRLSLDYDLGWGQPNGLDLVRRMVTEGLYPEEVYLHSSDPAARRRMFQELYIAKPENVRLHMHPVPHEILVRLGRGEN